MYDIPISNLLVTYYLPIYKDVGRALVGRRYSYDINYSKVLNFGIS